MNTNTSKPKRNPFVESKENIASKKEQLLAEIMALAVTTQYRTDRCVFVDFSGHINMLTISIRNSRDDYSDTLAKKEIVMVPYCRLTTDKEKETFERDLLVQLEQTKASLEGFIEKGAIDIEDFIKKVHVSYTF